MAGVFETYSKRKTRAEKGGAPDVYTYDELPQPLRIQVCHIWRTAIGPHAIIHGSLSNSPSPSNAIWNFVHEVMTRELGVFRLANGDNTYEQCRNFLLSAPTLHAIDIIELSARAIELAMPNMSSYDRNQARVTQTPEAAILELNTRFREHAVGYQYENGEILRVDSQFVHSEVVVPAIGLLNGQGYEGPAQEFLNAHAHYRQGSYKEAMVEALKAFESTMKAIADERKWSYSDNATAKTLIDLMLDQQLIPAFLTSQFASLRSLLESGLPTTRNKLGGHGQGTDENPVPGYFAAYALHTAASNILLLVNAHMAMK